MAKAAIKGASRLTLDQLGHSPEEEEIRSRRSSQPDNNSFVISVITRLLVCNLTCWSGWKLSCGFPCVTPRSGLFIRSRPAILDLTFFLARPTLRSSYCPSRYNMDILQAIQDHLDEYLGKVRYSIPDASERWRNHVSYFCPRVTGIAFGQST